LVSQIFYHKYILIYSNILMNREKEKIKKNFGMKKNNNFKVYSKQKKIINYYYYIKYF